MGFPHCGTTILRKLIGNSPNVHDVQLEALQLPDIEIEEDNIVIKFTCIDLNMFVKNYPDFKVVAIIKNPFDVFGSINRRFKHKKPKNHKIPDWDRYAKSFIKYTETPVNNVFLVKYEDLFENSYEQVKKMYKFLDLEFNDDIITTKRDVYISPTCNKIPLEKPNKCDDGLVHGAYRTWQTNQPFENQTGKSRTYLTNEQEKLILSLETIKKLNYN